MTYKLFLDDIRDFNFIGRVNAYAEFVADPEDEMALKPANVSCEQAAGATMAALTAWASLVKFAKVKKRGQGLPLSS